MPHRPLSKEFTHDGFRFRQVTRQGDVALFEKTKPDHSKPHYEIMIIQRRKARVIYGQEAPAREVMPTDGQWGLQGWTAPTYEHAQTIFQREVERIATGVKTPKYWQPDLDVIGDLDLCAWQVAPGVVWVQTRKPKHARRMDQRSDSRLVARGVSGGYLRTCSFVNKSLSWAGELLQRY